MEKEEEDRVSECKCEKLQRATHNTGHRLVTNYNQSRYARYTRKSETTSTTHRERGGGQYRLLRHRQFHRNIQQSQIQIHRPTITSLSTIKN